MKVECIHDGKWYDTNIVKRFWQYITGNYSGPKKGDKVTVESEYWHKGEKYYVLVEWPDDWWRANSFKPLDEQFESVTYSQIKEKASVN